MSELALAFLASVGGGFLVSLVIYCLYPRKDNIKIQDPDQLDSKDFSKAAWDKIKEFSETLK